MDHRHNTHAVSRGRFQDLWCHLIQSSPLPPLLRIILLCATLAVLPPLLREKHTVLARNTTMRRRKQQQQQQQHAAAPTTAAAAVAVVVLISCLWLCSVYWSVVGCLQIVVLRTFTACSSLRSVLKNNCPGSKYIMRIAPKQTVGRVLRPEAQHLTVTYMQSADSVQQRFPRRFPGRSQQSPQQQQLAPPTATTVAPSRAERTHDNLTGLSARYQYVRPELRFFRVVRA